MGKTPSKQNLMLGTSEKKLIHKQIEMQGSFTHQPVICDEENKKYYDEYIKLYQYQQVLYEKYYECCEEIDKYKLELEHQIDVLRDCEDYTGLIFDILDTGKQKRYRRTAKEIQRKYKCGIDNCQKAYGTEGSLNQHLKLKHPSEYVKKMEVKQMMELNMGPGMGFGSFSNLFRSEDNMEEPESLSDSASYDQSISYENLPMQDISNLERRF